MPGRFDEPVLLNGDCLDLLSQVTPASVSLVLADLPYGTTQNPWDSIIPLDKLWPLLWRALQPNGVVALTAAQPFTSVLVASQLQAFKYSWVWQKSRPTGHMNAKKQPMREHEDICVFYRAQPTYNPQFLTGAPNHVGTKPRVKSHSGNYGKQYEVVEEATTRKYPKTILPFPVVSPTHVVHPTQKPVPLMEYFIRTYTNPGDLVLDVTMGSGTTGVAAIRLGRRFIGMELDADYCGIARGRVLNAELNPQQTLFDAA
ncbi:MAG TPA: site-specific DNA-methyltransferase [Rhizobiaceae bacterium]|nr:site-specific DNA-methyltransferase [Rhizobiaceae bacterium]